MNAMTSEASLASPGHPVPRAIMLVGPLPPPAGGMANQTQQLAALLRDEGCEVTVVRTNADYRSRLIARMRGVRAVSRLLPFVGELWQAAGRAELAHVMANSGWAWHLFAAPAIWIAALRGVPVVINYRGGDAERFFSREMTLVRPTAARAASLVVPSGFLSAVFSRFGLSTTIVPNIVDLALFSPAEALPRTPHLLITRNLEAIYDIATAIKAFSRFREAFPGAVLTIAGEGPERASLEALASELGVADATKLIGRRANAELPALYRSASALVNPSRVDNMPVSVLEALASGVPVVSTDVGGVPFLVSHERDALLVPAADPQAMADALARLHREPALAERLRLAGIENAKRYAWPRVRPLLFAAYAGARGSTSRLATTP